VWREAIAVVAEERAPTRSCFLHRDYQHFNMPWARERLTGVVDWSEACIGPSEVECESRQRYVGDHHRVG
jgi:aminoglycoside phosphotransferase (APT) family kinase protein